MYTYAEKQKRMPVVHPVVQQRQSESQPMGFVEHRPRVPVQRKENRTGLPDGLKEGVESLSGLDMSDIRVHRNSAKPASVNALAYTQGTDIHVAPGQERHLPHEVWHAVQQKQGRVKATGEFSGMHLNDNQVLEEEASVMGAKALHIEPIASVGGEGTTQPSAPVQMKASGHIIQMQHILYRGLKKILAEDASTQKTGAFRAGAGEFGAGLYFWYDNPKAALISAVAYNGDGEWAVIKATIPDEIYDHYVRKQLDFPSNLELEYGGEKPLVKIDAQKGGVRKTLSKKMSAEEFRKLNQIASTSNVVGGKNDQTAWGYDAIKGPSAADYSDDTLHQIKFEHTSMPMFMDRGVTIEIVAEGPAIPGYDRFAMNEKKERYEQLRKTRGVIIQFKKKW